MLVLWCPALCAAQGATACLVPIENPRQGPLTSAAGVSRLRTALVGVVHRDVLRTVDDGRTWQTVAHLASAEDDAVPRILAGQDVVVVIDGPDLHVSRDSGLTFTRFLLPVADVGGAAALSPDGETLLIASTAGLARLRLDSRGVHLADVITCPGAVDELAMGDDLIVALAGDEVVVLRGEPVPGRASAPRLPPTSFGISIAVDGSGDVWVASSRGLLVLNELGTFTQVIARSWAPGEVLLVRGSAGELVVLVRGAAYVFSDSCPTGAPSLDEGPASVRLARPRRRHPISGSLPTFSLSIVVGLHTKGVSLALAWPLPHRPASAALEARDLELDAVLAQRRAFLAGIESWETWALHRRALAGRWPPAPDSGLLEAAVTALQARTTNTLWMSVEP